MKFEPEILYFNVSGQGTLRALKVLSVFQVRFYMHAKNGAAGTLAVNLLEKASFFPYGITGTTGPWHRTEIKEWGSLRLLNTTELGEYIIRNHLEGVEPPVKFLSEGLGRPVDTINYGV